MCVLSDSKIQKYVEDGKIGISNFDINRLQPSSYDVIMSNHLIIFRGDTSLILDTKNMVYSAGTARFIEGDAPASIRPGEFMLASTRDIISLPSDIVGRVEGKSSLGRIGLMIHSTAGYIDPGFSGQITLELSNIGRHPIYLYDSMPIAQISFMKVSGKVRRPYGSPGLNSKYQSQFGATESRYGRKEIEMEAC